MSLHAIPEKPSTKRGLQTFMVIAEKEKSTVLQQISSSFNHSSLDCYGSQADGIYEALESENKIRTEYSSGSDILYLLEDLKLGAKGELSELNPGRRVQLTLGEPGGSRFFYRAILLDARQQSDPFSYHCGVFLVPKTRAREWLFSSEEGQWLVVESSKAARLIMVLLDSSHTNTSMDDIQKDLSPLVKQLEPKNENKAQIPFMAASDGIKERKIVHQVTSALTGLIIIDDVVYEKNDNDFSLLLPSKNLIFRRLTFQRTESLVQSEVLLKKSGSNENLGEIEQKKTRSSSKSRKRGNQRRIDSHASTSVESSNDLEVDHNYLASSYHTGIISGFTLISSYLESMASAGSMVKALVIGLGAGLLPMFLHRSLPFLHIKVVELDPVVLNLARNYFGFVEDERLKVHITDGIQFVREAANFGATHGMTFSHGNEDDLHCGKAPASNGGCSVSDADGKGANGIDILIVDVDSSDSSSGMTCPAADFVEEPFLLTVKQALSEHGLFVINLVSRSQAIKDLVYTRLNVVFSNLFCLQLEEDVNEVIFALNTEACLKEDYFPEACHQLQRLLKLEHPEWSQSIIDASKKIKSLR